VTTTIRLVEVLAALSLASDLGHDQPLEKSLRNAVVAARLGEELGLRGEELSATFYVALLRSMGCTSNSFETAALFGGEDLAFLGLVQRLSGGDGREWARAATELVAATAPPELAAARDERWFATEGRIVGRAARDSACEVSRSLAARLGLSARVQQSLDHVYERWDGHGPGAIGGEALHLPARVSHVVDVVEIAHRSGGRPAVLDAVRRRSGTHFDPSIAAVVARRADDLLADLEDADMLEAVLAAEPPPHPRRPSSELEALARAIADFADLKSPWTLGHSPAVAELAAAAAASEDRQALLIAGLLHDLGRVAVPNGIWDKAGPLGPAQLERVRLHTYYTERILARTPVFAGYAVLAGASRERLDGGGYHRAIGETALSPAMRVLAVADAYVAMRSPRPHRPALAGEAAAAELHRAVAAGQLCRDAVTAVLEAAGHGRGAAPPPPCGLSEREVEVLALLAQGQTNKQIGAALYLSPRTVQHHVAHIYDKIDRRTRAGAAMFAMEHRLVGARAAAEPTAA
jgi:HD-GYP domain-containing protein (c-di-GMP phosphodiesterase class II)